MTPGQVKAIWEAFQQSLRKSVWRVSHTLRISHPAVHNVVCKQQKLKVYKLQLLQKMQENDLLQCYDFATHILSWIAHDSDYLSRVCFRYEASFHISGKVSHHNCHI
jgi:hypothetical protein